MNTLKCPKCGFSLEPGECAKPICPDCNGALHLFSEIYDPPHVMPDIMRPCVNPETVGINSKNIEAHIAKIYKRLEAITVEIRKRKLTE